MKGKLIGNQKGFSLVELIVVIAIMGIVAVGGLISMSLVSGQNAKGCCEELESYIQQTRMTAMSRADATLKIYTKSDGVYVRLSTASEEVRIGKVGISASYVDTGGNTVNLTSGTELEISFDRSSGAFKPLGGGTNYCDKIVLKQGERIYTLKMIPRTGKFYRE